MNIPGIFTGIMCGSLLAISAFTGCKQDKDEPLDSNDNAAYGTDAARLEQAFSDIQYIADEAAVNNYSSYRTGTPTPLSECATVTNKTDVVPHRLTVDFGPVECLCTDGRYRKGQIIVTYNGKYLDSAGVHHFEMKDYYVDGNQVLGNSTVTNMGHNAYGDPFFKIEASGSVVFPNNGGTISGQWERTRTMVEGEETPYISDDVYNIRGTGKVTRTNGRTFETRIIAPLVCSFVCNWINQGTVEIIPENGSSRMLDYGDGNCDNVATVTINGTEHKITIR